MVWKHQSFEILQELQMGKYLDSTFPELSTEKKKKLFQLLQFLSDWFWDKLKQFILV